MLYQKLTCKIVKYLEKEGTIEEKQREDCKYGLEVLISSLCLNGMLFIVAFFLKAVKKAIIYYALLAVLRKYAGGYHAKTYFKCTLLYLLTFVTDVEIERNIFFVLTLWQTRIFEVGVMVAFIITVIAIVPIENINNPLTEEIKKKYQYYSIILTLIVTLINLACMRRKMLICHWISICLFTILVYMYVGKVEEKCISK